MRFGISQARSTNRHTISFWVPSGIWGFRNAIPGDVFEGLEAVRKSNLTNMLDRPMVAKLARGLASAAQVARRVQDEHCRSHLPLGSGPRGPATRPAQGRPRTHGRGRPALRYRADPRGAAPGASQRINCEKACEPPRAHSPWPKRLAEMTSYRRRSPSRD